MTRWCALALLVVSLLGALPPPAVSTDGPVVARVYFRDRQERDWLGANLDVWEVHPEAGYVVALVQPAQRETLRARGYRVHVDERRTALLGRPLRALPGQTNGIPGYPCYRTVEETQADLARLASEHPGLARWTDIGDSWDKTVAGEPAGYDLHALVLTNEVVAGPKPRLFVIGGVHARELAGAELAARFAEFLVTHYGLDPDVTWLLDYTVVHIVPQANPDGRKRAEAGLLWRKNTDSDDGCTDPTRWGTDLNRNGTFHWGGASANPCAEVYQGPAAGSEPETQAFQGYLASLVADQRGAGDEDPVAADGSGVFITLHAYGGLVLFPYDFRTRPAPNGTQLQTLGRKFGYYTGYRVCQSSQCLYLASGTQDDWAYGELGLAAYTFELGDAFFQDCATFEDTIVRDGLFALVYAAKAARRPYQAPAGPETLMLTVQPAAVQPGTPVAVSAVADDTRYAGGGPTSEPVEVIAGARLSLDVPSWVTGSVTVPMEADDGAFDAPVESLRAMLDTTGLLPGRHLVLIESRDAAGNWGVPSAAWLLIAAEHRFLPLVLRAE